MYEAEILRQFCKMPVFSLADTSQIIKNRSYAKAFLRKMVDEGKIIKIKKDFYTFHDDPLLISSFLVKPSYVSGVSALSFHGLISQIPDKIYCMTEKKAQLISFITEIHFIHTRHFFGFNAENYREFQINVAEPEKAIIDCLKTVPVSLFEEAFKKIDAKNMLRLLKKTGKSSIIKRIGFLMERNGMDYYGDLKEMINGRLIYLDPFAKKAGAEDRKWKVIVNG